MFDSKSPIVKYVGYAVIGFFGLIIVVSFGMPNILSKLGQNSALYVAEVNGEKIHRFDFYNFRDRQFSQLRNKNMDSYILDRYIEQILLLGYAKDSNFIVTDERVVKIIKTYFRDKSGKFSPEYFKRYKDRNRNWQKSIKNDFVKRDFYQMVNMGLAVSKNELKQENLIKNSKIQIKYSFLSDNKLKKRFKNRLVVKDSEVSAEMQKNIKEIKDPKTDKQRIRKKLENRKLADIKRDLTRKIDLIAIKGGNFSKSASILKGKVSKSNEFSPGEQMKEDGKKGKNLFGLANNRIFREQILTLEKNTSSRAIKTFNGIYVFTPILKEIKTDNIDEKTRTALVKGIKRDKLNSLYRNLLVNLTIESKSRKFLKTN